MSAVATTHIQIIEERSEVYEDPVFPGPELEEKLKVEAASQGVNVSIIVIDVLNKFYGLVGPNSKTEAQIEKDVLNEIAAYVSDSANAGTEFDINAASATYTQIDMTYAGKPKVVKARIGKNLPERLGYLEDSKR